MPHNVGINSPTVAISADPIRLQRRAERDDAPRLRLDLGYFEVQVKLLGVFTRGPGRTAVVVNSLEGEIDVTEGDRSRLVVAALH